MGRGTRAVAGAAALPGCSGSLGNRLRSVEVRQRAVDDPPAALVVMPIRFVYDSPLDAFSGVIVADGDCLVQGSLFLVYAFLDELVTNDMDLPQPVGRPPQRRLPFR